MLTIRGILEGEGVSVDAGLRPDGENAADLLAAIDKLIKRIGTMVDQSPATKAESTRYETKFSEAAKRSEDRLHETRRRGR